jgi:hypothetical protein
LNSTPFVNLVNVRDFVFEDDDYARIALALVTYLGAVGSAHHDRLNGVSAGGNGAGADVAGQREKYLPNILRQAIGVCGLYYAKTKEGTLMVPDPWHVYNVAYTLRKIEESSSELAEIYKQESEVGNSEQTKEHKLRADFLVADVKNAITYLLLQNGKDPGQSGKLAVIQSELARIYLDMRKSLVPILKTCEFTSSRNGDLLRDLDPFPKSAGINKNP